MASSVNTIVSKVNSFEISDNEWQGNACMKFVEKMIPYMVGKNRANIYNIAKQIENLENAKGKYQEFEREYQRVVANENRYKTAAEGMQEDEAWRDWQDSLASVRKIKEELRSYLREI